MPATRRCDKYRALLQYVKSNDVQQVHRLLSRGINVNRRFCENENQTALFMACSNGFVELAYVLLTNGADMNVGPCPLLVAVDNGHLVCVHLLLKHSVSAGRQSKALLRAWECKNLRIMELLLDHGANIDALCNGQSFEVESFLEAAGGEHTSLVVKLFDKRLTPTGADVVFVRRYAFVYGLRDLASSLLMQQPGANDVDTTTLALYYGAKYNWPGIVMNLLLNKVEVNSVLPGHGTALYAACSEGHEDIVKLLLRFGVNVNVTHDEVDDSLPLHVATRRGYKRIVAWLIDNGAVISRNDSDFLSADDVKSRVLRLAFDYGHMNVIECIAEMDLSNVSVRCSISQLLHEALLQLDLDRVVYLINLGADLKYLTPEGETLLHIVCSTPQEKCQEELHDKLSHKRHSSCCEVLIGITKLLLNKGLDRDVLRSDGRSPLYLACEHQHTSLVRVLVDAGCNVQHTPPSCGVYPLLKACELRNVEITEILLSAGADVRCVNHLQESALHLTVGNMTFGSSVECEPGGIDKWPSYAVQVRAVLAKTDKSSFNENDAVTVAEVLIKHGADCNAVSSYGETPLYRAVVGGARNIVRLLLKHGCNPNVTTTDKFPLFAALLRGDKQIMSTLCHSKIQTCMNIVSCSDTQGKWISRQLKTKTFDDLYRILTDGKPAQGADPVSMLIVMCLLGAKMQFRCEFCLESGLSVACEEGDESLVGLLLSQGADVNFTDVCGQTPLHCVFQYAKNASRCKSIDSSVVEKSVAILKRLLAYKPLLDAVSQSQQTPLYKACAVQLVDAVKLLLNAGANPNIGMSPLRLSCNLRNLKIAEMLVDHGALLTTAHCMPPENDGVPLIFAVQLSNIRLLHKILKHRPDVNELDQQGRSALWYAVDNLRHTTGKQSQRAAYKCFMLLMELNADVCIADNLGCSPLCMACEMNRGDLVEKMLECRAKFTSQFPVFASEQSSIRPASGVLKKLPLNVAADRGYEDIVSTLLRYGESVNQRDSQGNTAVHVTLKYVSPSYHQCWNQDQVNKSDYEAVLQILLKNGADVNILNDRGETPLCIAVSRGLQKVCCDLLLTFHADPNVGLLSKLPLSAACEKNDMDLVTLLLSHGADPDALAKDSQSMVRHDEIKHDVPADRIDNIKCTPCDCLLNECALPLCIAARKGNSAMLGLLLEHQASVDLCDNQGLTPLHRAIQYLYGFSGWRSVKNDDEAVSQMIACLDLLLEAGADPDCESRLGLGPIYYALSILVNLRLQLVPSLLCQVICDGKCITLMHAVIAVMKLLVDHGASIEDSKRNLGDHKDSLLRIANFLAAVDGESFSFIVWLFQAGAGFGLLSLLCTLLSDKSVNVLNTTLCKLVVLAGYQVSIREIEEVALIDTHTSETATNVKQDLIDWLDNECRNPPRLMRLTRNAVRNELLRTYDYRNIIPHIDSLEIPEQFKSYLKYESSLSEIDLMKAAWNSELCNDGEREVYLPEPVELQNFNLDRVFCNMEKKDVFDEFC
jgi:ankyrin repeat protein